MKSSSHEDRDHLVPLCEEILPHHSLLIFCPTKKGTQETALLLARLLPSSLREHKVVLSPHTHILILTLQMKTNLQ